MQHLTDEVLARLVDETASPAESDHLEGCDRCSQVLAELRRQTAALAALPPLDPPADEWSRVQARLGTEGLIRTETPARAVRAPWASGIAAAAALVAFLLGGLGGFAVRGADSEPEGQSALPRVTTVRPSGTLTPVSLDEAAGDVQIAEAQYLSALDRYNELAGAQVETGDPLARLAALESIVASSRAALNEAPYDPVFNGWYLNATSQRNAMFRQMSTQDADPWY
ncbi:MAG: hypothetical protein ABFS34_02095 [Gemmatimonadota bacterium]